MKPQRFRLWLMLLATAIAVTIVFGKVLLFTDRALLYRDLSRDFLVQKSIWANSVRAGNGIPYWNHFAFGGSPFWAMNVEAPLHPLNFIFLLFSPADYPRALTFFIWIHYILLAWGGLFWARTLRFGAPWALIFALAVSLSGYSLSAHNLLHVLGSLPCVPFCCAFLHRFAKKPNAKDLFAASFCIAWPIYAGDPMFAYGLGLFAAYCFLHGVLNKKRRPLEAVRDFLTLAVLAILASAAQLLPTLELILQSSRGLANMELTELLYFSFHPLRFLETVYPQFFGNSQGEQPFWALSLVNFIHPQPFIFSTYPGALVVFTFFLSLPLLAERLRRHYWRRTSAWLVAFVGFFLAMGAFSPVPLFQFCAYVVPLFSAFRYPERFLIWPLIALCLLMIHEWRRFDLLRALQNKRNLFFRLLRFASGPLIFWLCSLVLALALRMSWLRLPESALWAVMYSTAAFSLLGMMLVFWWLRILSTRVFVVLLLGFHTLDLVFVNTNLIWGQSKYQTMGERYTVVQEIRRDLLLRSAAIQRGGPQRLATGNLSAFLFSAGKMDYTTASTFTTFDSLLPNTAAYFGIEDISGYYSVVPKRLIELWNALIQEDSSGRDASRVFDLMSAYYLPRRNEFQIVELHKNSSALPYIFIPERVRFVGDNREALRELKKFEMLLNKEILILDKNRVPGSHVVQTALRDTFPIEKRDGRSIRFRVEGGVGKQIILINEGYDRWWQATVNGQKAEILPGNLWAMALELPMQTEGEPITVELRYRNPLIFWGILLTSAWFFLLLVGWLLGRKLAPKMALSLNKNS